MKWKDLTPAQLDEIASWMRDRAGEMKIDREQVAEEAGFDLYAGLKCVARKLDREGARRADAILMKSEPLTEEEGEALLGKN